VKKQDTKEGKMCRVVHKKSTLLSPLLTVIQKSVVSLSSAITIIEII